MAHKGRAYPLSPHRFINADTDYPLWAADTYECILPECTGLLTPSLQHRVFITHPGIFTPPSVLWEGESTDGLLNIAYFLRIEAQKTNDASFPSRNTFTLEYIQAFPPSAGTLATWRWDWPVGDPLDVLAALSVTLTDPLLYNPNPTIAAHARLW